VVSSNWREVHCRQLLPPPRLPTPAFADGVPVPSPGRCNALADILEISSLVNGKRETNMKDDAEDYPASYLLYVSSALVAIALVAAIAYVFLS